MNKKGILIIFIILLLNSAITNSFPTKKIESSLNTSISSPDFFQLKNNDNNLPDTFRIADLSTYNNFDPHTDFNSEIMSLPYDALIDYDLDTGKIIPSLAIQWVVTNDSKEWTFTLRENITFHDNSELNSSIVKYSLERFFDPLHPEYVSSPYWAEIQSLPFSSIELIDNLKFKIILSESNSNFLGRLAFIKIISLNSFKNSIFDVPIGTGPYKIDLAVSNETYINFTRFDDHFRGLAPFKFIQYQSYGDRFDELEEVIESEEVDMVLDLQHFLNYFNENDYLGFNTVWNISYIGDSVSHDLGWFNHELKEFSDPRVRQALNYAINKQDYADQVRNGLGTAKTSVLTKNLPYYDQNIQGYPYDLEFAEKLLDEAGYPVGLDGYRFDLEVVSPGAAQRRSNFVCSAFELIDIKCSKIQDEFGAPRLFSRDFDFYVVGIINFPDIGLVYDMLNSKGSLNFGSFSDSTLDIIISLGLQTPVKQEQEFYYKLIQKLAQDEAPYLLLSDWIIPYALKKDFSSVVGINKYTIIGFYSLFDSDPNQINLVTAVEVSDKPVYTETTDSLIYNPNEFPLVFNIEMTNNESNILPSKNEIGKFYKLEVDNQHIPYFLKIYYDLSEIESLSNFLSISQYNSKTNSWKELNVRDKDENLRYLEIEATGNIIIKLIQKFVTYVLVPFVFILTILMTIVIIITVVRNQKIANYLRKMNK